MAEMKRIYGHPARIGVALLHFSGERARDLGRMQALCHGRGLLRPFPRYHEAAKKSRKISPCLISTGALPIVNIHRPSRWLFICGHSPRFSHAPSQAQVRPANCLGLLQWPVNGLIPYLPFEPPVNGLSLLFPSIVICSPSLSSSSWCLMYSAIAFVFFPTVST